MEKSTEWKLPPNVYNLDDFTKLLKNMGKRGPYQCFTVERDDKTVRNNYAPKPENQRCETDFYDLPSTLDDGKRPTNSYKNRFLKAPRFVDEKDDGAPPPTKYYPQNFTITLATTGNDSRKKSGRAINPFFFYPNTSVPMLEMKFNKEGLTPDPGRYDLHNLSCRCRTADKEDRAADKKHRRASGE